MPGMTVANALGMSVSLLDYGATLTGIVVPDRTGAHANVVLGPPDEPAYRRSPNRWGTMGRYAGRLARPDGVMLHGGADPFDRRDWQRHDFEDCCSLGTVFSLDSPEGDQDLPGHVRVEVTYRLMRDENRLRIEYRAQTDKPTALNLTNHVYFNLAGAGARGIGTHRLSIAAERYAETDAGKLPTGRLLPVADTPLDFRRPASIGERLAALPDGFDHGYVFSDSAPGLKEVLTLEEPGSGRRLEIATTEPALQLFSGNVFDGREMGAQGRAYESHDGLALETQHLPDSPNHPHFPSTEIRPGKDFHSVTSFRFSALE